MIGREIREARVEGACPVASGGPALCAAQLVTGGDVEIDAAAGAAHKKGLSQT